MTTRPCHRGRSQLGTPPSPAWVRGTGLAGLGAIAYLRQAIRHLGEGGDEQGQSSCYAARSDGVALARALSTNLSSVLISTIRARLDCLWRDAGESYRDRNYRGFGRWPSLSFQIADRCRGVSQGRFVLAASHRCLSSHGQSLIPSPVAATARLPVSSPGLRPFLAKQETGRLPSSTAFRPP